MVFLVNGVLRCSSSSNKTWYSAWLLDAATGIIPERASLVFDRERAKATKGVDQTSRSSQLDTDSVFLLMELCQDYFDSSCFVTDPAVYQSVCFKPGRQRLKKSTLTCPIIPTIFKRIREIETKERRSRNLPFQKRRNLEISRSDSAGGKNMYQMLANIRF